MAMQAALRREIKIAWDARAKMIYHGLTLDNAEGNEFIPAEWWAEHELAFNNANLEYEMARYNIRQLKHQLGGVA